MSERHLKVKMVHSIRKRRKTIGEQTILEEGGTQSTTGANLKLDNMAWINYHKQQCQITNPEGKKKSMNEIRVTWNNLSREGKLQYTMPKKNDVDEKVHVGDTHNDNDVQPFDTRCTPTRFSQMVSTFSDLQKDAVRELGFGNLLMLKCGFLRRELCAWLVNKFNTTTLSIELHGKSFKLDSSIFSHVMGISDRGDTICIDGAIPDIWKTKFSITNRGIKLLHLEGLLKNNKTCDDDFKVTFCLHTLGTILAPAAGEYVDARYLNVLADVGNIKGKNWARWCFDQLVISIKKFQSKSARYIGGCVLFLEVLFIVSHII